MDPNHKKGQGSSNRSSKPPNPRSCFKGIRNIDVSNSNHQIASNYDNIRSGNGVEGTERVILFQLGSIASSGVISDRSHPKKYNKEVMDEKKILMMTSSSSSLSSSSTPSDDMIEINAKDENNNKCNEPLFGISSRIPDEESQESQVSVVTHTQSPPVQVMDRGSYDPRRIPSSVFSGTGALEWSEASNESLFSLNIGVISELRKSGNLLKSGELISFSPSLSPLAGDFAMNMSTMEEKKSVQTDFTAAGTESEEKSSSIPVVSWSTPCDSNISDQTPASMPSFSQPIVKGNKKINKKNKNKRTKTKKKKIRCCGWEWLKSCFHCGDNCCTNPWPCCSCWRWPRCSCHFPSCCNSCCSRLFCCHWSCCSSCSAEVADEEMRREYKEQKLQATEQAKVKSSLYHEWFCCFHPCFWCCSCRSCSCSCHSCSRSCC